MEPAPLVPVIRLQRVYPSRVSSPSFAGWSPVTATVVRHFYKLLCTVVRSIFL